MKKIIILLSMFFLFSCNNNGKDSKIIIRPHEYSDVENLKINWDETLNKDRDYFVYYYGDHCSHCHEIKNEVISYALEGSKTIYFCNDINIVFYQGNLNETIGKTNIYEIFINATPSLIEVKDKTVIDNVCGTNKVLKKIRGE